LFTLSQSTADKPDRLIGLLTVPQVFGAGACDAFEAAPIPLFARPRALEPVASIEVDTYWTFPRDGGCEGLQVRVHEPGLTAEELPTKEFEYEAPAAIVIARDEDWFQIRTARRPLWLRGTAANVFLPIPKLLSGQLSYLTLDWDGSIFVAPGGSRLRSRPIAAQESIDVIASRTVAHELWLLIETTDGCTPDTRPAPKVRGWIRAYGKQGAPAAWFYSRGC
jgi:hypothetical protein